MEDALQSVVNHHLDRLTPGTTVDAMEAFAFSVPTDVIGDLLGVPHADREQLRVWWEAFLTRHEGEVAMPPSAIEANRKISAYIGDLIDARRTDTRRRPHQHRAAGRRFDDPRGRRPNARSHRTRC